MDQGKFEVLNYMDLVGMVKLDVLLVIAEKWPSKELNREKKIDSCSLPQQSQMRIGSIVAVSIKVDGFVFHVFLV